MVCIRQIINFFNNTGKIPNNSDEEYENELYMIIEKLRKKNTTESILLDKELPCWRKKQQVKTYNKTVDMITFVQIHNRLPCQIRHRNRNRNDNEDYEYTLACWFNSLKQSYFKNNEIDIHIKELLDQNNIQLIKNNPEKNAINQANKVLQFWNENNKLPQQKSKANRLPENNIEYKLATWINSQKLAIKGKNNLHIYPEVIDILTKIPGILN